MIVLTSSDVLRVTSSSTSPVDAYVAWSDVSDVVAPGRSQTGITTAATTTIATAPAVGVSRKVGSVSLYNRRTGGEQLLEVQVFNGATASSLFSATLQAGEQISYETRRGWQVVGTDGEVKSIGLRGATGATGPKGDKGDPGDDGVGTFAQVAALLATADAPIDFNAQRLVDVGAATASGDAVNLATLQAREGVFNVKDYGALGYRATFTVNPTTNVLTTATPHGMSVGQQVLVDNSGGALPGGTFRTSRYYVIAMPTTTTLRLSDTPSGEAGLGPELDITSAGTGTHRLYADDAAAFTAALAAMQATGGVLFLPRGVFTIGGNVTAFNGAGAGSHFVMRGCGSSSILRFQFTGHASYVFTFTNVDGVVAFEDVCAMGTGTAGDHDFFCGILLQSNGRNVFNRCCFYGVYGLAGVANGSAIEFNGDIMFRDSVFVASRGQTAIVVGDGVRSITFDHTKCLDVGSINGEGVGKVADEGPWVWLKNPQQNDIYGGADAGMVRVVNCRWDEAPRTLFKISTTTPGRRWQMVTIEQSHFLLPHGGCAIDIADCDYVRLLGVEVGSGGNVVAPTGAVLKFSACRLVEMVASHSLPDAGLPGQTVTDPYIQTDADTEVLMMRACDGWDLSLVHAATRRVDLDSCPTITGDLTGGDLAATRATLKQLVTACAAHGINADGTS
jgi:hypothetical protein